MVVTPDRWRRQDAGDTAAVAGARMHGGADGGDRSSTRRTGEAAGLCEHAGYRAVDRRARHPGRSGPMATGSRPGRPDAGGQISPPSEPADLAAAIELREALRAVLLAHAPHPPAEPTGPDTTNASSTDAGAIGTHATSLATARSRLAGAAAAAQARIVVRTDGSVGLAAAGTGSRQALAALLLIAAEAATTGSWTRLKACAADDCHWAFYDRSPTRNGCWCSMQICGSRAKSRAYRSRAAVLTGSGRATRARTRL